MTCTDGTIQFKKGTISLTNNQTGLKNVIQIINRTYLPDLTLHNTCFMMLPVLFSNKIMK